MKFRVINGKYTENGTTYTRGAIVDTSHNLIQLFGSSKFEQIQGPTRRPDLPSTPDVIEAENVMEDVSEEEALADVFEVCRFGRTRHYFVKNVRTGQAVGAKEMTKKDAVALADSLNAKNSEAEDVAQQ